MKKSELKQLIKEMLLDSTINFKKGSTVDYHGRSGVVRGKSGENIIVYFADIDDEVAIDRDELKQHNIYSFNDTPNYSDNSNQNSIEDNIKYLLDDMIDLTTKINIHSFVTKRPYNESEKILNMIQKLYNELLKMKYI